MREQSFEKDFYELLKNFNSQNIRSIREKIFLNNKIFKYMQMMKEHDIDTYKHSVNVAAISVEIAKVYNYSIESLLILVKAALLHDIGKIHIDKSILNKPSKLSQIERTLIEEHSLIGYRILVDDIDIEKEVAIAVLQHHERNDRSGYPNNLCENEISFFAKIIAVADIFDAMLYKRPYKRAWPLLDVMQYINSLSGTLLDSDVVTILNTIYNVNLCKGLL